MRLSGACDRLGASAEGGEHCAETQLGAANAVTRSLDIEHMMCVSNEIALITPPRDLWAAAQFSKTTCLVASWCAVYGCSLEWKLFLGDYTAYMRIQGLC